jgi:hypothetical protein
MSELVKSLRFQGRFGTETEDQARVRRYHERIAAADRIEALEAALQADKAKGHGHREDFYLLANCRRMLGRTHAKSPNWVIAMELFATGSTSAYQICTEAGIDPDSTKVERAAIAAKEKN